MEREIMLTTIDNPYNPFTHFDEWFAYDEAKGYYTCSYLARFAYTSSDLSDLDQQQAIEKAMDEIVFTNPLGIYKKIYKDGSETKEKETS